MGGTTDDLLNIGVYKNPSIHETRPNETVNNPIKPNATTS